ncbi:MAG: hypothetical protein GX995_11155 [Clostridiales bacterium]|nr:hypothetical protein [Clostridiales bacterium]
MAINPQDKGKTWGRTFCLVCVARQGDVPFVLFICHGEPLDVSSNTFLSLDMWEAKDT